MGSSSSSTPPRQADPTDRAWSEALERVLADPERVRPLFQPIVDLDRGVAIGYEMLARFVAPIEAAPPRWLAEADRRGLGSRLEALLVESGLSALEWVPDNCFLTINVSPRALGAPEVAAVLAARESLEGVVIEVTEQAVVDDYSHFDYVLRSLRAAGAAIAVDDAGAGYASLQHIVALRPQFVKLDASLVAGLDGDEAKLAVIESLGTFSSRIDAWMVAEGVERPEEVTALQRLRVPLGQGFRLGRPSSAMEPVSEERREQVSAGRPVRPAEATVAGLVEAAPASALAAGGEGIAQTFAAHLDLEHVTVLDAGKRPVAIVPRQGFFGGGARERPPLRVDLRESLAAIARRAMARPVTERFDPVVCCDARGRYVGVVKVERLVEGLTAVVEGSSPPRTAFASTSA
jgi:EAL domain-containing protein (putative c-di-GMP-specific phosphodiesterase class I)